MILIAFGKTEGIALEGEFAAGLFEAGGGRGGGSWGRVIGEGEVIANEGEATAGEFEGAGEVVLEGYALGAATGKEEVATGHSKGAWRMDAV
jgi:hypothetical protein